jgi:hypothetical protein
MLCKESTVSTDPDIYGTLYEVIRDYDQANSKRSTWDPNPSFAKDVSKLAIFLETVIERNQNWFLQGKVPQIQVLFDRLPVCGLVIL